METKNEKNYYYVFLIIFTVLAFLIRIEVIRSLLVFDLNVLYPSHVTDMYTYHNLASKIVADSYSQPYIYQPFYYAVFLSSIFKIFSENILYVLLTQAMLGALTVFFAAQSAKKLWNRKAGLMTAILLTFSQILIFYTSYLLIVTVQAFLITMLLYFSLTAYSKKGFFYWGIAGLVLGCSILTRGNMWFVLPGMFLIVLIRGVFQNIGRGFLRKLLPSFIFIVFVILPQIPFVYVNTMKCGKFSGPSMAAGDVLLFGNTPESPPGGNEAQYGAGIIKQTVTGKYWNSTESENSIIQRIWGYLKNEPLSYTELTFRKFLLFWDINEIPNNVDFNKNIQLSEKLRYLGFIPTFIILILGGAGCLFFIPYIFKKNSAFIIPLYILGSYWVGICLFYMLARFRAPILPVLAVCGGGMLAYMFSYSSKKGRSIAIGLLLILGFAFLVFHGYSFYRYNLEHKVMRYVRPDGTFVELGNRSMVLDNGPMIYGSWNTIPLNPGTIINKKLVVSDTNIENGIFEIPIVFLKPGFLVLMINNKKYNIESDKPGSVEFKIKLENLKNKIISDSGKSEILFIIKILKNNSSIYAILDHQRQYGRTRINGKVVDAELVCRLFLEKNNQDS